MQLRQSFGLMQIVKLSVLTKERFKKNANRLFLKFIKKDCLANNHAEQSYFHKNNEGVGKMKRLDWLLVKFAVVFVSLAFFYGYGFENSSAQGGGKCNTSQACGGTFSCHCGDSDCGGCYIPNGQGGCGTCAGGGAEIIL